MGLCDDQLDGNFFMQSVFPFFSQPMLRSILLLGVAFGFCNIMGDSVFSFVWGLW